MQAQRQKQQPHAKQPNTQFREDATSSSRLPSKRHDEVHRMNASAYGFLAGLGQKISAISGDDRETCYLFQRISVLIQRFNATLLHESFADENRPDD